MRRRTNKLAAARPETTLGVRVIASRIGCLLGCELGGGVRAVTLAELYQVGAGFCLLIGTLQSAGRLGGVRSWRVVTLSKRVVRRKQTRRPQNSNASSAEFKRVVRRKQTRRPQKANASSAEFKRVVRRKQTRRPQNSNASSAESKRVVRNEWSRLDRSRRTRAVRVYTC
jgi:hypothetical protein